MFIVTGAASGIGHATAQSLATRNSKVVAVARKLDQLDSLRDQFPDHIQPVQADLSGATGIDSVISAVRSIDTISGIVHAAGTSIALTGYKDLQPGDLVLNMAVHVSAPISLNNRLSVKLAGSRILFIDSFSANAPRIGWTGYSIVKAAAQMAARAAAAELNQSTVIRVFPGGVRTPLVNTILESSQRSPTVDAFKKMDTEGSISDASTIGTYLTDILLNATDRQLAERESWDFTNASDRIF